MELWTATPDHLIDAMRSRSIRRAFIVTSADGRPEASHALFEPVTERLAADRRDFRGHEGLFLEIGARSDHLLGAFLHQTIRGQGAGGVRFWQYGTVEHYLRDGLRLSRGMGHKCALAGLWWGGGKGVIARRAGRDHLDPAIREAVYTDYGDFVSSLRGCYVTAEDVGTTPEDMARVFSRTRHTTCIPQAFGGSGNPSELTAKGVVVAMEAALEHLGRGGLAGKTVALQGLGQVSRFMIGDLLARGVARIVGVDVDSRAVEAARSQYPDVSLEVGQCEPDDHAILARPCDVLAPNAVGATLNPRTIPTIEAAVVCGGANNQLEHAPRDGALLRDRGVLYVPDFLANRMGIVNCANEPVGILPEDPAVLSHLDREQPHGIYQRALEIFARAEQSGRTTADEAERRADELALEPHPIWGHRGRVIIDSLVRTGWAEG